MNCSRYRQLISRYVDDEVTPRQRRELLAHVEICRECAAWLARARQTDVLLKSVGNEGPSDRVKSAILSQIRRPTTDDRPNSLSTHDSHSAFRIPHSAFRIPHSVFRT